MTKPVIDIALSRSSPRVKVAHKLARRRSRVDARLFLADGPMAVAAALDRAGCAQEVFGTRTAASAYPELVGAAGARWTLVEDAALALLSDSVTPAGVVAVCRFLDQPLTVTVPGTSLVVICADVRDPGNAGTILRTSDAAGAAAMVFAGNSVDPYNPKAVRASAGSLFQLPITTEVSVSEAVRASQAAGLTVLAADGRGEMNLDEAGELLARPTAWLFGNEAWGLPAELAASADHRVRIPIYGQVESLNLSVAAALCVYASARRQQSMRLPQ
ncbi:MAG: TrmH family RNA methyltransferase [Nocardioides sp.]